MDFQSIANTIQQTHEAFHSEAVKAINLAYNFPFTIRQSATDEYATTGTDNQLFLFQNTSYNFLQKTSYLSL